MGNGCYLCDTLPWWMCCLHLVSAHVINICTHVWPLSLSRHIFHVGNIQEGIMIMTVWKGGCRTSNFFQYLEVLVQQKQVRNNMQHQPQYNFWNNKRFCHRIFIKCTLQVLRAQRLFWLTSCPKSKHIQLKKKSSWSRSWTYNVYFSLINYFKWLIDCQICIFCQSISRFI